MRYRVTVDVAYEGEYSLDCNTLDEVKAFIQDNMVLNPGRSLDDYEVMQIGSYVDVYSLMKEGEGE